MTRQLRIKTFWVSPDKVNRISPQLKSSGACNETDRTPRSSVFHLFNKQFSPLRATRQGVPEELGCESFWQYSRMNEVIPHQRSRENESFAGVLDHDRIVLVLDNPRRTTNDGNAEYNQFRAICFSSSDGAQGCIVNQRVGGRIHTTAMKICW